MKENLTTEETRESPEGSFSPEQRQNIVEDIREKYGILFVSCIPPEYTAKLGAGQDREWFESALGLPKGSKEFKSLNAMTESLPNTVPETAIIVGGSPLGAYEKNQHPWMQRFEEFLQIMHARRKPMLGVCFGHQIIAQALGGEVIKSPKGREFGTLNIDLTAEGALDPLFQDMPERFVGAVSHQDTVSKLPELQKTAVLARSGMEPHQALGFGDMTRTVQLHPELTPPVIEKIVRLRQEMLQKEGFFEDEAGMEKFIRELKDTPEARQILHNFVRNFVIKYGKK